MAGDDEDDYPLSDGELSFSRWRSNSSAEPPVRSRASSTDDPVLDLQPAFGHRVVSETGPSWDHAPSSGLSSPGSSSAVSDREFENEFGFAPHQSTARTPDFFDSTTTSAHSLNSLRGNGAHGDHDLDDTEKGSHGSSELSLQDLVERQEDDLISSRKSVFAALSSTLLYISIWYLFSTGLTIYNKKLLGAKLWDFPAPLLMNTVHFSLQAVISWLVLRFLLPTLQPTSCISWKDYVVRVVPTAIATALDVDFTNASLVFISISFETMCKSAAPVFLLLFAFAFKLEVPSFRLFGIISIISSGVLLTGLGSLLSTKSDEQRFELVGFILVMLAAVMSGFRWTVTQVLLQKKEFGLNNPLAVMSQLAPVMAILTGVLSLASEPWHKLREPPFFDTYDNAIKSSFLLLLGGSLAFFMVLAEYLLISKTSAVTLTVAGVVKEVVTILVAVVFLGDDFSAVKGIGLAVIMVGVCWFNWFKYQKFKEGKHQDHVEFERLPVRYIPLTDKIKDIEEVHML